MLNNDWYVFIESIRNTYMAGGVVMLPILLAGIIGFYYLYSSWFRIGSDFFRKDVGKSVEIMRQVLTEGNGSDESLQKAMGLMEKRRGLLSRELRHALKAALLHRTGFSDYAQVRMIKTVQYMEQGSHIVAVMAGAAPLLGLLGTVTGMVSTFDVITLYGNQNPVLMADGISEALISTQSGLLVAFPLTLLKQRLDERIDLLRQQMELGATILENAIMLSLTKANTSSPT